MNESLLAQSNKFMNSTMMGMKFAAPETVITQACTDTPVIVANTLRCLERAAVFHDFENSVFGHDFWCSYEDVRPWIYSGDLFYSAVLRPPLGNSDEILSIASILIVDATSYHSLARGESSESELVPFSLARTPTEPVFYYSSLVLADPRHLVPLLRGLRSDIAAHLTDRRFSICSAFTIPSGEAGIAHVAKCGFRSSGGRRYLGRYEVMSLTPDSASVRFWREIVTR